MGLKDLVDDGALGSRRRYSKHPREEEFMGWVEEFQERFPEEVQVDFIEVSPRITKKWGYAYSYEDEYFIRLGEHIVEAADDKTLRLLILHEMAHLYFSQMGYEVTERDPLFTWVLGRIGADVSGYSPDQEEWKDIVEPFLRMDVSAIPIEEFWDI